MLCIKLLQQLNSLPCELVSQLARSFEQKYSAQRLECVIELIELIDLFAIKFAECRSNASW